VLQADLTGTCKVFDWTNPAQLDAYFALHQPFEQQGVDFFWLDWCCDASSATAPGLSSDTWINSRYAARERARGLRWLAFSRMGASFGPVSDGDRGVGDGGLGAFAEHRYTIQFTGDTCATWSMLAFEAQLTASEGNVGLPYVSHDIGSFNGQPVAGQCTGLGTPLASEHLPDDIYARWVQFGTFQPLDRLHSNHGDRLPRTATAAADAAAADFLRLREALEPYTYTLARRAYDTGLPITGALYLRWPRLAAAYEHRAEYTFGRDLVVEPVTAPGDPAPATVWVPPGTWVDYFTGRPYIGPSVQTLSVPLSQMPVLVRAGAIVPTQAAALNTPPSPARTLILTAFPGATGTFTLYDDAGVGFGYTRGEYARTSITQVRRGHRARLVIGRARGRLRRILAARAWSVRFLAVARPRVVRIDGRRARDWSYDRATQTLTVATGAMRTSRAVTITAGP
jgi:alpha-glucosidase (family GH31 glycosyl hydrolase)